MNQKYLFATVDKAFKPNIFLTLYITLSNTRNLSQQTSAFTPAESLHWYRMALTLL